MGKQKIRLRDSRGQLSIEVPAEIYGFFGVHTRRLDPEERIKKGYIVTHIKTGVKAFPRLGEACIKKEIAIYAAIRLSSEPLIFNFTWEEYKENNYRPPQLARARELITKVEEEILAYTDPMTYAPMTNVITPDNLPFLEERYDYD